MQAHSIRYVVRREINITRWNECIDQSPGGRIYAYSFYLDRMARHWDALVYGDYEAVMPLTWNKKYGISYCYQPAFSASLGVFGQHVTKELTDLFLAAIPRKFRLIEIELNHRNLFDGPAIKEDISAAWTVRTNYVLGLDRTYETIYSAYNKNLQRNLNEAEKQGLRYVSGIPVAEVMKLARIQMQRISNVSERDFTNFGKLFAVLHARGQAIACGVYAGSNEPAASAVFFFSHKRAYYILVGNRVNGRVAGASHFLLDRFIHDHAQRDLMLDFEGSDIPGLANFYGGFGAVIEPYPSIRINRLPRIINGLRRLIT